MLPLIDLTQADIDRIVDAVPGGAANIQDIYPLAPLQEGILFHHLLATEGDPYLLTSLLAFPDRALLDSCLAAVQQVVDRHDILRTAFLWEGLPTPAQVVWRHASSLSVTEVALDPKTARSPSSSLSASTRATTASTSARRPCSASRSPSTRSSERWLAAVELLHHLIARPLDAQDAIHHEIDAVPVGKATLERCSPPQPFRNLVAQARLGVSADEHERFFRGMLGDIDEPTLPFGLTDTMRDGDEVGEPG